MAGEPPTADKPFLLKKVYCCFTEHSIVEYSFPRFIFNLAPFYHLLQLEWREGSTLEPFSYNAAIQIPILHNTDNVLHLGVEGKLMKSGVYSNKIAWENPAV